LTLLFLAQLLFLSGITLTIGAKATAKFFFFRPKNWKVLCSECAIHGMYLDTRTLLCWQGSGFFLGGTALVLVGWTFIGLCVEAYGFWLLFSGFIPNVLLFIRRVPYVGKFFDLPVLKTVSPPP
jgi:hypothetical protein